MANMIADEPMVKHQYIDSGLIGIFLDLIDCNPDIDIMRSVVWCLGNLVESIENMQITGKKYDQVYALTFKLIDMLQFGD